MTLPMVLRSKNILPQAIKMRKSPISDGRVNDPPLQSITINDNLLYKRKNRSTFWRSGYAYFAYSTALVSRMTLTLI